MCSALFDYDTSSSCGWVWFGWSLVRGHSRTHTRSITNQWFCVYTHPNRVTVCDCGNREPRGWREVARLRVNTLHLVCLSIVAIPKIFEVRLFFASNFPQQNREFTHTSSCYPFPSASFAFSVWPDKKVCVLQRNIYVFSLSLSLSPILMWILMSSIIICRSKCVCMCEYGCAWEAAFGHEGYGPHCVNQSNPNHHIRSHSFGLFL